MNIQVSIEFLETCAKKNSCGTLNMHPPEKSSGQVIEWKRHHWVCTGSVHQGMQTLEADLRMVVPEVEYHGRPNGPDIYGLHYYTGGRLRFKSKTWVMTSKEITLIPFPDERRTRPYIIQQGAEQ